MCFEQQRQRWVWALSTGSVCPITSFVSEWVKCTIDIVYQSLLILHKPANAAIGTKCVLIGDLATHTHLFQLKQMHCSRSTRQTAVNTFKIHIPNTLAGLELQFWILKGIIKANAQRQWGHYMYTCITVIVACGHQGQVKGLRGNGLHGLSIIRALVTAHNRDDMGLVKKGDWQRNSPARPGFRSLNPLHTSSGNARHANT